MLGVVDNPVRTPSDDVMEKVATDMGVADTFHPTPVGVFFGGPGQPAGESVEDPFFGGAGPARNTCLNCGECMSGCRHNAKNTLVKNYLYLAEQNGATVLPLTTATRISPRASGGYDVRVKFTKAKTGRGQKVLTAEHVVMAAASLGTQRLLHRMRDEGHLPRLSSRLGHLSRTNSESILGAIAPDLRHDRLLLRGGDHLVVPPRRRHPHRAGALRQGLQHDGDAADRAHRRRRRRPALAGVAQGDVDPARPRQGPLRLQALVRAHRDRPGDAEPRQLDHDVRQARQVHPDLADDLASGPRRTEPVLDPGRQRRRPPDGGQGRRHPRRQHRRAVRDASDRALHRRLRDRGLAGDTASSTPISVSTATRACTSPTAPRSPPTWA